MTSSSENIFRVTDHLFGESTSQFPSQSNSNLDIWCFFVSSLNKLLSKRWIDRIFETTWRSFDVTVMVMVQHHDNRGYYVTEFTWRPSVAV